MRNISSILDEVLGCSFEIECAEIRLRGSDNTYRFSGPGSITGQRDGPLNLNVHNRQRQRPGEFFDLVNAASEGAIPMCLDATDYTGCNWVGGWAHPMIIGTAPARCYVTGSFPQLFTDLAPTSLDERRNSTVNFYPSSFRLPMMEVTDVHRIRRHSVERRSSEYDHTELDFDGAVVMIREDSATNRTEVSTTHSPDWSPPYCETALANALQFVCASPAQPRVTIRYLADRTSLFIRQTPTVSKSALFRPIAFQGVPDRHFWNLFLAFLRHCRANETWSSRRLSDLCRQLIYAGGGTAHILILSLVVAIEDLVDHIMGRGEPYPEIEALKRYIRGWNGDADLKGSAISLVASLLSRTSTRKQLRLLTKQGVVTDDEVELWAELRPKLAHGKMLSDQTDIFNVRNRLTVMFYRLALRLIGYRGLMSDWSQNPSKRFDFQWDRP